MQWHPCGAVCLQHLFCGKSSNAKLCYWEAFVERTTKKHIYIPVAWCSAKHIALSKTSVWYVKSHDITHAKKPPRENLFINFSSRRAQWNGYDRAVREGKQNVSNTVHIVFRGWKRTGFFVSSKFLELLRTDGYNSIGPRIHIRRCGWIEKLLIRFKLWLGKSLKVCLTEHKREKKHTHKLPHTCGWGRIFGINLVVRGFYDISQLFYMEFDTWRLKSCQYYVQNNTQN